MKQCAYVNAQSSTKKKKISVVVFFVFLSSISGLNSVDGKYTQI